MLKITKPLIMASAALVSASCIQQPQSQPQVAPKAPTDPYATQQQVTYPPAAPEVAPVPVYPPATPTVNTPTVPVVPTSGQTYTIQKGDTLFGISKKTNTSVEALRTANSIYDDLIYPGETIVIP